ncbi:MAG: hypothetical protein KAT68_10885 [Bacteroidales bacterium]|nr:hypothetical protein [Bacteroidales bacterium]
MKTLIIIYTILFGCVKLSAQSDSTKQKSNGLINANMLHPTDAFTAYTLNKGEWAYNQALTPYPSWAWWGITDWLTTELDFEAWLGGVPSFNFRFALLKQKSLRPAIAYETMYQYLSKEIDLLGKYKFLSTKRMGNSWYNKINASWKLKEKLHLHFSTGATYSEKLTIDNADSLNYEGKTYNYLFSPDFSASIDCRIKNWISLHTTASYGSTFLYIDNVPTKQQFAFGTRIAPFINNRFGFLRCFRLEATVVSFYFKAADHRVTGPIGFIYWQWDWSKN